MQSKKTPRDTNQLSLAMYFHARKPKTVEIDHDSKVITIHFGSKDFEVSVDGDLCASFANLRSFKDVKEFVAEYGWSSQEPNTELTISRDDWKFSQEKVRWYWKSWASIQGLTRFWDDIPSDWPVDAGEMFKVRPAGLSYYANDLIRVMDLFLASQPARVLKICPNPECLKPFLFVTDGRNKLCGEPECKRLRHVAATRDYRANGPKGKKTKKARKA